MSWKIYQDSGRDWMRSQLGMGPADPYPAITAATRCSISTNIRMPSPGGALPECQDRHQLSAGGSLFDLFRQDVLRRLFRRFPGLSLPRPIGTSQLAGELRRLVRLEILDALTADPEVWSPTAFFLTYDENDGFFDHVVPPTPPQTRTQACPPWNSPRDIAGNSQFPEGPYGLGMRVPMLVISPWSRVDGSIRRSLTIHR